MEKEQKVMLRVEEDDEKKNVSYFLHLPKMREIDEFWLNGDKMSPVSRGLDLRS